MKTTARTRLAGGFLKIMCIIVLFGFTASAQEVSIVAEADSLAQWNIPSWDSGRINEPSIVHFGFFGGIGVRNPDDIYGSDAFMRFNLYDLDPAHITEATLRLYSPQGGSNTLVVNAVDEDDWDERIAHVGDGPPPGGEITRTVVSGSGWIEIDVTNYLRAQTDLKASFHFELAEVDYHSLLITSKDGRTDWRPHLLITHTQASTSIPDFEPVYNSSSTLPLNSIWLVSGGTWTQYATAQQAVDAAGPGDEVVFGPGRHYQSFDIRNDGTPENPIVIRGDGDVKPILDASGLTSIAGYGRGLIGVYAKNIVIENLELRDASRICGHEHNASGIFVNEAENVTVRNCYIHHNGNGVFTTKTAENYTQEYCEVAYNSYYGAGYEHGHYLGNRGTTLIRYNHIHSNGGQGYKDRCANTVFAYNYVHDNGNYELDFMKEASHPGPMNALVMHNVVRKARRSTHRWKLILWGEDRHGGVGTFVNNTLIATHPDNSVIQLYDRYGTGQDRAEFYSNIMFSTDESTPINFMFSVNGDRVTGTKNWLQQGATALAGLTQSVFGTDPGIDNIDADAYPLQTDSDAVNPGGVLYYRLDEYVIQNTPAPDITPPVSPGNLQAQPLSADSIQLSWDPSSDPESGLKEYVVTRDGTVVASVTTPGWTGTGLAASSAYTYTVEAVNYTGLASAPATVQGTTLADGIPPSVDYVVNTDTTHLTVVFSEPIEASSAEVVENYILSPGAQTFSASLGGDFQTVTLTTSQLEAGRTYTLTILNLRDRALQPNLLETVSLPVTITDLPASGLVHAWLLDGTSDTFAEDSVDPTADGVLGAGAASPDRVPGRIGNALHFDGVDDRVDIPSINLDSGAFTMTLWMNLDSQTVSDGRLFSKALGTAENDHVLMLSTINDRALRFRLKTAGNATETLIGPSGSFSFGTWHHVAVVYDGSELRMLIDGVENASMAISGAVAQSADAVTLGNQPPGAGDRPLDGLLDQIRLHDRALSPQELETLRGESPDAGLTFSDWIQDYNPALSGNDALPASDPDGNGIPNLFEYAQDFDSSASLAGMMPAASDRSVGGEIWVFITWRRNNRATDLVYTVDAVTDLGAPWEAVNSAGEDVSESVLDPDIDGDGSASLIETGMKLPPECRIFFRLKVGKTE